MYVRISLTLYFHIKMRFCFDIRYVHTGAICLYIECTYTVRVEGAARKNIRRVIYFLYLGDDSGVDDNDRKFECVVFAFVTFPFCKKAKEVGNVYNRNL